MSAADTAITGGRPLVPSGVLGMVLFISTEAMFFAALISAYLVLRAQAVDWPPFDQPRLPVGVTGVNTAVLLLSGWTMQRALAAARARKGSTGRWLAATALLGSIFLAIQGTEWARLIGFGLTTSSSLYGGTFYTLVGAHGLHVLAALVVLLVVAVRGLRGHYSRSEDRELELCRMYWLFVVAVWPVLYVLVYLR
jgi:heme/copper-type cytochrome/quinol oxidase subunit 3